jgi:hypothetical protein
VSSNRTARRSTRQSEHSSGSRHEGFFRILRHGGGWVGWKIGSTRTLDGPFRQRFRYCSILAGRRLLKTCSTDRPEELDVGASAPAQKGYCSSPSNG